MAKMNKDTVVNQINNLIKSGKADEEPKELFVPQMQIENLYDTYEHLLKSKTKKDLTAIKSHNLLHQYNKLDDGFLNKLRYFWAYKLGAKCFEKNVYFSRSFYQTRYIAVKITGDKEEAAIKKIFSELDFLTKKGFLKGHLALPFRLNLPYGGAIIATYVLVSEEGSEYIDNAKKNIYIEEGALPKELEE